MQSVCRRGFSTRVSPEEILTRYGFNRTHLLGSTFHLKGGTDRVEPGE